MAMHIVLLFVLLAFAGAVIFSVRPGQRAAVLAALPLTLGAVAALYAAVIR